MDLLFFILKPLNDVFSKKQLYSIVDSWKEEKLMSAYLIHSLPLKMSAIQIFLEDKKRISQSKQYLEVRYQILRQQTFYTR